MRALQANEFGDHLRVVVAELDFVELLRAELYVAVLTHVRPEVARMDPLSRQSLYTSFACTLQFLLFLRSFLVQ